MGKPVEGIDRCYCGSKYWDENVCHSCGEKFVKREEVCVRHMDESAMRDGECQECLDDKHEAELVARFR